MRSFFPADLARDYDWNEMVEGWFSKLLGDLANEPAYDFFKGARSSYDWAHGPHDPIKIEFKTTSQNMVPIEVYKNREGTIKSGLSTTEADAWLILSNGRGPIPPGQTEGINLGKLRIITPKLLRAAVRGHTPVLINKGGGVTEQAYVVNVNMTKTTHWWMGDVPTHLDSQGRWLYDFDRFIPARGAEQMIQNLFEFIRQDRKDKQGDIA